MSKHTPGPWGHWLEMDSGFAITGPAAAAAMAAERGIMDSEVSKNIPFFMISSLVRTCTAIALGNSTAEAEANARLIAAAPQMLEALRMFVHPYQEGNRNTETERQEIGRAAILKATGEQP